MLSLLICLLVAPAGDAPIGAKLLLTNRPGTLFMRWQQGEKPDLPNVEVARRGERIAAVILFSSCSRDSSGTCDLWMDMTILDPAGKTYGQSKDTELWVGKAPPATGDTELGVGYLMIRIEPRDPAGRYLVSARVSDRVSGKVETLERALVVNPVGPSDSTVWPPDKPKPDLSGFWKDHCEDDFGLRIDAAGGGLYSISFCGPGGCFEPGTYRPNSSIFGDESYRVVDADTVEVLGHDGFTTYYRCPPPKGR